MAVEEAFLNTACMKCLVDVFVELIRKSDGKVISASSPQASHSVKIEADTSIECFESDSTSYLARGSYLVSRQAQVSSPMHSCLTLKSLVCS